MRRRKSTSHPQKGLKMRMAQKKAGPWAGFIAYLAERSGFEPEIRFWRIHAFQACLLSHSSISPFFGTANIGIFHNYFQKNVYICRINHKLEDYEKGIVCTDSRRRHLRDVKLRQRVRLHGEGKRSGHFQGCNDTRGRRKLLGLQQLQEPLRHLRRSLVHPAALLVYSFGNQQQEQVCIPGPARNTFFVFGQRQTGRDGCF